MFFFCEKLECEKKILYTLIAQSTNDIDKKYCLSCVWFVLLCILLVSSMLTTIRTITVFTFYVPFETKKINARRVRL